jgi:hypothetical protein
VRQRESSRRHPLQAGAADSACGRAHEGGGSRGPHAVVAPTIAFHGDVGSRLDAEPRLFMLRCGHSGGSGPDRSPCRSPERSPCRSPCRSPLPRQRVAGTSQRPRTSAFGPPGRAITRPRPAQRQTRAHGRAERVPDLLAPTPREFRCGVEAGSKPRRSRSTGRYEQRALRRSRRDGEGSLHATGIGVAVVAVDAWRPRRQWPVATVPGQT